MIAQLRFMAGLLVIARSPILSEIIMQQLDWMRISCSTNALKETIQAMSSLIAIDSLNMSNECM